MELNLFLSLLIFQWSTLTLASNIDETVGFEDGNDLVDLRKAPIKRKVVYLSEEEGTYQFIREPKDASKTLYYIFLNDIQKNLFDFELNCDVGSSCCENQRKVHKISHIKGTLPNCDKKCSYIDCLGEDVKKLEIKFKKTFESCTVNCTIRLSDTEPPVNPIPNCSSRRIKDRINGGQIATPHVYPWIAGLKNAAFGVLFSSGALITSNKVLTAAFEIWQYTISDIEVILGDHDITNIDGMERSFQVLYVDLHPDFDPDYYPNDLAVVTLDGSVDPMDSHIQTISLPPASFIYESGLCSKVCGWGTNDILHCIDIYTDPTTICGADICAGNGQNGPCFSISSVSVVGTPLVYYTDIDGWMVIGLFQDSVCNDITSPGFYVGVQEGAAWINSKL